MVPYVGRVHWRCFVRLVYILIYNGRVGTASGINGRRDTEPAGPGGRAPSAGRGQADGPKKEGLVPHRMIAGHYEHIVYVVVVGLSVAALIAGGSYMICQKAPDGAKVSAYECGFDPFGSARTPFAVRFFLVGVLFIVFDLELSYVFPWGISFNVTGPAGYWAMFAFLVVLTAGFLYE